MTATGLSVVGFEKRADENVEQVATKQGTGRIVQVGSYACSKTDFDNRDGHVGDRQSIPCPEGGTLNRDYDLPVNRSERFSEGFSRNGVVDVSPVAVGLTAGESAPYR